MPIALNPNDGVELAWDAVGEGPAMVLVHGSALSKAIWRGFGYTRAFRDRYKVITMDLRGHGRSGKPDQRAAYRIETLADDVLAVLDAAGVAAAHYGGYSVGGRIGFSLAAAAPERLLTMTSLGGSYRVTQGSIARVFFPGYDDALAMGGMPAFVDGWEAHLGRRLDGQTRAAFLSNDAVALRAYFAQTELEGALADELLTAMELPTLLLAGTEDPRRLTDSLRAAELMPHARVVELPGRNHGTTLVPAQPVLDEWVPFLDAH